MSRWKQTIRTAKLLSQRAKRAWLKILNKASKKLKRALPLTIKSRLPSHNSFKKWLSQRLSKAGAPRINFKTQESSTNSLSRNIIVKWLHRHFPNSRMKPSTGNKHLRFSKITRCYRLHSSLLYQSLDKLLARPSQDIRPNRKHKWVFSTNKMELYLFSSFSHRQSAKGI